MQHDPVVKKLNFYLRVGVGMVGRNTRLKDLYLEFSARIEACKEAYTCNIKK